MLKRFLAYPSTRGRDLDDPQTTELRRRILKDKAFLRRLYVEWYRNILRDLPSGKGAVLEIGSGAGFFQELLPEVITSDVLPVSGLSLVLDAQALPLADASLRAVVLIDVLHHLPDVERFLVEAARCVRPGGVIVMIEPWVTAWSRWIWGRLHHEPFDPDAESWTLAGSGPLSRANVALPWIVLERDRGRFEQRLPEWRIAALRPCVPFRYLVSGGMSLRSLMPGWSFGTWRWLERRMQRWMNTWGLFAHIVLCRTDSPGRTESHSSADGAGSPVGNRSARP